MEVATFREDLPEFADVATFPGSLISFWADIAEKMVADRWGTLREKAVELYVAHNVVLSAGSRKTAAAGGMPGGSGGIASSKTVGSVSVSYDTTSAMLKDAGHWNQTSYGRQYVALGRLIGAGCVQL